MRRIVSVFILFTYIGLTTISVVSIHYCHENIHSVKFSHLINDCCGDEYMNENSCCMDFTLKIDFNNEHITSQSVTVLYPFSKTIISNFEIFDVLPDNKEISNPLTDESPHLRKPQKKYLLTHSFLFYS